MDRECVCVAGGITKRGGYPVICLGRQSRKRALAHRFTYEFFVGKIPDGLVIDHMCRNPRCCWPPHLRVVTHQVNILAGNGATAWHARKTHCPKGHDYTPKGAGRYCRPCHIANMLRYREQHGFIRQIPYKARPRREKNLAGAPDTVPTQNKATP